MGSVLRRCASCRTRMEKRELTRFVVEGEQLRLDLAQRLPGRGAYLCKRCFLGKDARERIGGAFRAARKVVRGGMSGECLRELVEQTSVAREQDARRREELLALFQQGGGGGGRGAPPVGRFSRKRQ